jgi:hypothetical protein
LRRSGLAGLSFARPYFTHKKLPPPQDHCRVLGIGLLKGERMRQFLMSEAPL